VSNQFKPLRGWKQRALDPLPLLTNARSNARDSAYFFWEPFAESKASTIVQMTLILCTISPADQPKIGTTIFAKGASQRVNDVELKIY